MLNYSSTGSHPEYIPDVADTDHAAAAIAPFAVLFGMVARQDAANARRDAAYHRVTDLQQRLNQIAAIRELSPTCRMVLSETIKLLCPLDGSRPDPHVWQNVYQSTIRERIGVSEDQTGKAWTAGAELGILEKRTDPRRGYKTHLQLRAGPMWDRIAEVVASPRNHGGLRCAGCGRAYQRKKSQQFVCAHCGSLEIKKIVTVETSCISCPTDFAPEITITDANKKEDKSESTVPQADESNTATCGIPPVADDPPDDTEPGDGGAGGDESGDVWIDGCPPQTGFAEWIDGIAATHYPDLRPLKRFSNRDSVTTSNTGRGGALTLQGESLNPREPESALAKAAARLLPTESNRGDYATMNTPPKFAIDKYTTQHRPPRSCRYGSALTGHAHRGRPA